MTAVMEKPEPGENLLKENDKSFIKGLKEAIEVVKLILDEKQAIYSAETTSLREKLEAEIAMDTLDDVIWSLERDIADWMVAIVDEYEDDDFDPVKEFGKTVLVSPLEAQIAVAKADGRKEPEPVKGILLGDWKYIFGNRYVLVSFDEDYKTSWVPCDRIISEEKTA